MPAGRAQLGRQTPKALERLPPRSERRNPPRYSVPIEKQRKSRDIIFFDPTDRTYKPAWTPLEGYAENPTREYLRIKIGPHGLVGTEFENGWFPYAVDLIGDVVIGQRLMPAAPQRYWPTPTPTLQEYSLGELVAIMRGVNVPTRMLIGGRNPEGLAFGRVHVSDGKIDAFDNVEDPYAPPRESPPRESLDVAEEAFKRLPAGAFARRVKVGHYSST